MEGMEYDRSKSNEETNFMYDIDLNDLPNSVDYHLLYCLDADEKNNNLTLQYDDGRYLNQEYKVKMVFHLLLSLAWESFSLIFQVLFLFHQPKLHTGP